MRSPISPSPAVHVQLKELLGQFLKHTPTARGTDSLMADLRRFNPELLRDSLVELLSSSVHTEGTREEISSVYTRKLKEMAALYPLLFHVENALRARLSLEIFDRFGIDQWWVPILKAIRSGNPAHSVKQIGTVPITRYFAVRVGHIVESVEGTRDGPAKLDQMTCGSQLLAESTFGELRYLVSNSWTDFQHIFRGSRGVIKAITKLEFSALSKVIVDVRNDLYHHRPISDRQTFVNVCEILADHLESHLGSLDTAMANATYVRPSFSVVLHDRHFDWR
ncbi:MAG: hypothetical protein E5X15_18075 [Mesorhizobium sp.]|nr:MAG: hypothetical protein E5X15_18075 [Mesorhizobium sp.]